MVLPVAAKLTLVKRALPAATVGRLYSAKMRFLGGVSPRVWTAGKLPAGLRITPRTGVITGIPRRAGTATVTIRVTDKLGAVSVKAFTLKIAGATTLRR
jgi:Putative Ig domain